jgi:type III restriction enzyme
MDGIKYEKIEGQEYEMSLFEDEEIIEEMSKIVQSNKSPFELIAFDSMVERSYAKKLNEDTTVKFFTKLPKKFKIETPIGKYNPDWAILKDDNGLKLYFVRETKGSVESRDLRGGEKGKIECAKRHFYALGVDYKAVEPPFIHIS